ncbi:glutaredoxin domain-containing protein [Kluyvera sichuanensis]
MKNVVIYGRENCSYCTLVKGLATEMQTQGKFEYFNINAASIEGAKLSEVVDQPVWKIPQTFIDGQPIGGYTEFAATHI